MRHLPKILALLVTTNMLCVFAKADLPPGTLEIIKNSEVEELDLSGQGLGSDDIMGLGNLLESNTTIKTLNLADNCLISSEEIVKILCANDTLEHIDLRGNFISERCINNAILEAKKQGKYWNVEATSRFCLKRIFEKGKPEQLSLPDSSDNDSITISDRENRDYSQRKNQKKRVQERARARLEKWDTELQ